MPAPLPVPDAIDAFDALSPVHAAMLALTSRWRDLMGLTVKDADRRHAIQRQNRRSIRQIERAIKVLQEYEAKFAPIPR
jgi:hypothetical protein